MTFDILRKIMENYFGYNVNFVMNITDIDDKIIVASRQNYLYEKYVIENSTATPEVIDFLNASWSFCTGKWFNKFFNQEEW